MVFNLNGGQGGTGQDGGDVASSLDGSECSVPSPGNFIESIDCPSCNTRTTIYANFGSIPAIGGLGGIGGLPGSAIVTRLEDS